MRGETAPGIDDLLTPREREVLELLRLDLTNEQIAQRLGISLNGAKYHVSEIIGKLGVGNRREAARWPEGPRWWATALAPVALMFRRAGAALPVNLSSAAMAASGGILLALAGGLGLIAFLLVRGGSDVLVERVTVLTDPQTVVEQAQVAKEGLDSYHVAFISPTRPEDIVKEYRWEFEFDGPDSYRGLLFAPEGEQERRCESYAVPGGTGETCHDVFTSITGQIVSETILAGDKAYARQCEDVEKNCEPWQEGPRPEFFVLGPSPTYLPQWPFVALEMMEDAEMVGEETVDGTTLIHIRGSVNHMRAIFENQRRVVPDALAGASGEECTLEPSLPGEPPGEETCRELTLDEEQERQEEEISYYDEHPATMDIWLSLDDVLVRRISFGIPSDVTGEEDAPLVVEYSELNEVEIKAPR